MAESRSVPDSWLVRRYVSTRRGVGYLTRGLQALHQAIWLGILSREQLAELTEWRYQQWAEYTDAGYNLSGLEKWEERVLDESFASCQSVLIGAAGGGREVAALTSRGLEVGAFECSREFAEAGNQILEVANVPARIELAEPDQVPESLRAYDGFIMGWGGYMHVLGRARRIRFLRELAEHLNPGAPVLLSFFTRSGDGPTFRWSRRIANVLRWFRLGAEKVEIGDLLERTWNHRFTRDEVRAELEAAGFEMLHFAEEPYGHAVGRLASGSGD